MKLGGQKPATESAAGLDKSHLPGSPATAGADVRRIFPLLHEAFPALRVCGWVVIRPTLGVGLLLFNFYPFVYSFMLSLTNFRIGYPLAWVKSRNYVEMFTDDPLFGKSFGNTAYFVALGLATSLLLALLLNQKPRGIPFVSHYGVRALNGGRGSCGPTVDMDSGSQHRAGENLSGTITSISQQLTALLTLYPYE